MSQSVIITQTIVAKPIEQNKDMQGRAKEDLEFV